MFSDMDDYKINPFDVVSADDVRALVLRHPVPWSVELSSNEEDCYSVNDANGNPVIYTDCGYFPPDILTANFIVKLVNYFGGRL